MKFQDKEEVTSDEIGKAFALVSMSIPPLHGRQSIPC